MPYADETDLMTIQVYEEAGKWSWQCCNADDLPICGSFGYRTEAEAYSAALEFMDTLC